MRVSEFAASESLSVLTALLFSKGMTQLLSRLLEPFIHPMAVGLQGAPQD